jgi:cyclopropane fatty-acyl-phospholipid synthase-like methyltransferase
MNRFWKYIAHFWYVAINWNIWMAFFMAYDNIRGTLKYGRGTFIPIELKNLTIKNGDLEQSSRYEAVSFYMLEHLFSAFRKLSGESSITDLGCGKGRMMMVAPHFGFTNITGVDFAKEVCAQAEEIMRATEVKFPGIRWQVLHENVADHAIRPGDSVFFMFNPFTEVVLNGFLKNLDKSCAEHPRTVYFLYASPQHQDLLQQNGFAVVYEKQKMYLKSIIAVRDV